MPLPAVLAWAASNPSVSIPIATTLASSLYRWINPDRARELQMDVLESHKRNLEIGSRGRRLGILRQRNASRYKLPRNRRLIRSQVMLRGADSVDRVRGHR